MSAALEVMLEALSSRSALDGTASLVHLANTMVEAGYELAPARCVSVLRIRAASALAPSPDQACSRLIVCLGEGVTFVAGGESVRLSPRDVIWISATPRLAFAGPVAVDVLIGTLQGPYAPPSAVHLRACPLTDGAARGLLVRSIVAEVRAARAGQQRAIAALLEALATYVLPTRSMDAAIERALGAMSRRPGEPWSVQRLAKLAGLSRAAFARRFAQAVGEPPSRRLTRLRLELAATRLLTTKDSLAEIAALVGYASEFAFSKAFKRHFNAAPGHYRRGHVAQGMLRAA
jgi:AraC-like DNA-binding protein